MTIFRKRIGSDVFHWSLLCPGWPGNSYEEQSLRKGFRPVSGELCDECLKREKAAVKKPTKRKHE